MKADFMKIGGMPFLNTERDIEGMKRQSPKFKPTWVKKNREKSENCIEKKLF